VKAAATRRRAFRSNSTRVIFLATDAQEVGRGTTMRSSSSSPASGSTDPGKLGRAAFVSVVESATSGNSTTLPSSGVVPYEELARLSPRRGEYVCARSIQSTTSRHDADRFMKSDDVVQALVRIDQSTARRKDSPGDFGAARTSRRPSHSMVRGLSLHRCHRGRAAGSAARCPKGKLPGVAGPSIPPWIRGHSKMDRTPTIVRENHKDEQQTERDRWHHKEIGRDQVLHMVLQKGPPRCEGGFRCRTIYFATVACETWIPSFINSP